MSQAELSFLSSYSIQSLSFSDIKQNLDYLDFHVCCFIQMIYTLVIGINIASMTKNVLVGKLFHWIAIEKLP